MIHKFTLKNKNSNSGHYRVGEKSYSFNLIARDSELLICKSSGEIIASISVEVMEDAEGNPRSEESFYINVNAEKKEHAVCKDWLGIVVYDL